MEKNSHLLNMKPLILFNKIPFIHKSSIFYTSIRIHQDCKSLQQGIGEMTLFLQYWKIIHEISCIFDRDISKIEIHIIYTRIQNNGAI